jgi:hypothetical protein
MDSDALWFSILSGLLFLVWGDHLWHAFNAYRRERNLRSFRGLFIAVMLQVGLLRIWIGATVRAAPDDRILPLLNAMVAPLLTLLLLSGGFVVAWTWRRKP